MKVVSTGRRAVFTPLRALIVGISLALSMVLVPQAANAAEYTVVSNLTQLKAGLTNGGKFMIAGNIDVNENLTITGKSVELIGNGSTIAFGDGYNLTVSGANGGLTIGENITVTGKVAPFKPLIRLEADTKFNMTGGKVKAQSSHAVYLYKAKQFSMTGGEIETQNGFSALKLETMEGTIEGGKVTNFGVTDNTAVQASHGAHITIIGGTFVTGCANPNMASSVYAESKSVIEFDTTKGKAINAPQGISGADAWEEKRTVESLVIPAGFTVPSGGTILDGIDLATIDPGATDGALQASLVPGSGGKKALKLDGPAGTSGLITMKQATDSSKWAVRLKIAEADGSGDIAYRLIQGKDRFDTALKIAGEAEFGTAKEVILVSGYSPIDGVIAAPLAIARKAPVLYGNSTDLGAEALAWVKAKGITKVTTVGAGRVSADTKAGLPGVTFEEFTGSDRFDTAAKVAAGITGATNAYVADGMDLVDPMAAAVAAGQNKGVVLLSNKSNPAAGTDNFLAGAGKSLVLNAVGGPAAAAYPAAANKIVGADRYATALLLAKSYITSPGKPVIATSGIGLVDAVPSAVVASLKGGALIYVKPGQKVGAAVEALKTATGHAASEVIYVGALR